MSEFAADRAKRLTSLRLQFRNEAGDQIMLAWAAANRDPKVFADPHTFDGPERCDEPANCGARRDR